MGKNEEMGKMTKIGKMGEMGGSAKMAKMPKMPKYPKIGFWGNTPKLRFWRLRWRTHKEGLM